MTDVTTPTSSTPTERPHRIVDGYRFDCQGGGCILEMAERNARRVYRATRTPHPWDEWTVESNTDG